MSNFVRLVQVHEAYSWLHSLKRVNQHNLCFIKILAGLMNKIRLINAHYKSRISMKFLISYFRKFSKKSCQVTSLSSNNMEKSIDQVISFDSMIRPVRKALIREDLVDLTGDYRSAIVLNQLIYWSKKTCDIHKLTQSECICDLNRYASFEQEWIIKSARELCEETMVGLSRQTMRVIMRDLVAAGWLEESLLGKFKSYKTAKYRLNIVKIQKDLKALGYESFKESLLQNKLKVQALNLQNSHINKISTDGEYYHISKTFITASTRFINHQNDRVQDEKNLYVTNLTYKHSKNANSNNLYVSNLTYMNPQKFNSPFYVTNLTYKNYQLSSSQNPYFIDVTECNDTFNDDQYLIKRISDHQNQHKQNFSSPKLPLQKFFLTHARTYAHAYKYIYKYNIYNNIYSLPPLPSLSQKFELEPTAKNERENISQKMVQIFSEVVLNGQELKLFPARTKKLESVLQAQLDGNLDHWHKVCLNITHSKFLMGEAKTSNFKASLDWLIKDQNATKVFEGAYGVGDRVASVNQPQTNPEDLTQSIEAHNEALDMQELRLWFVQKFGQSDYNSWFKGASFNGFDGRCFKIAVNSAFIRDQIASRFASYIWDFLKDKYMKRISFEISVKPKPLTASSSLTTNQKEKRP